MKYTRFIFAALLLATFFSASCSHSPQVTSEEPDPKRYEHIVLVGTNDFHGYLRPVEADYFGSKATAGGAEWFASYAKILEKKYGKNFILLDGGDLFQGTMESNIFVGEPVSLYYNMLPYRAAAIGNHEFDYGAGKKGGKDRLAVIKTRIAQAKFPFLSANIFTRSTNKNWEEKNLHPSTMFEVNGIKVGVIGLTTESAPTKTLPKNVVSLEFRSIIEAVKQESSKLRSQGANLIFITAHEGGDNDGQPMFTMLNNLPRGTVDAVVAGHSHLEIRKMINSTPVIESFTRGRYFGRIDLYVDKTTKKIAEQYTKIADTQLICGTWFANSETCDVSEKKARVEAGREKLTDTLPLRPAVYEGEELKPDLAVRKVLQPYFHKVDELRSEVLAQAAEDFQRYPTWENDVGHLFVYAMMKQYPQVKVAYFNGGGFRRLLTKGPITYADLYEVMPFDNNVALVKLTGKDFREMVKVGVSGAQSIPAVGGVRLSYYDSNDPKFDRDVDGDGKKSIWERDRLAELHWSNGKEIKDEEEFWVVTNDYLVQGGDNLHLVFKNIPKKNIDIKDLKIRDAMADYLRTHKKEYYPVKLPASIRAIK